MSRPLNELLLTVQVLAPPCTTSDSRPSGSDGRRSRTSAIALSTS
jgi:hypothetical protein